MSVKKIPDMFLRGLKRKSDVLVDSTVAAGARNTAAPLKSTKLTEKIVVSSISAPSVIDENTEPTTSPASPPPLVKSSSYVDLLLMDLLTDNGWKEILRDELAKKYVRDIESFLNKEYRKGAKIFPPRNEIFTAFNISKLAEVRVVIIGQDPYHDDGQAHGLSFSVKKGVRPPPSLKNIYKELVTDIPGFVVPDHGNLEGWARQGVFLLNASLTVEAHKANSHAKIGWQRFTDHVIGQISKHSENIVFVLWGGFAHKKETLIDAKKHAVVKTAHPSPLSFRHWTGCKCFSKINEHLEKFGRQPVDWKAL